METGKLTSKYQTTIPQEIRHFLGLDKGDAVRFNIVDGWVLLAKANPATAEERAYLHMVENSFSEWHDDEDDELLPPWRPHQPV